MKFPIEIRAHHLLCIPRFYRGGYDSKFAMNMKETCQYIRKNPSVKIKILVAELDVLCGSCPYNHEQVCVQSEQIGRWVKEHDKRVAEYLEIKTNSVYKASEVFNLSMEKVTSQNIESICLDCIFLENCMKVGINNSFMKDINKKR